MAPIEGHGAASSFNTADPAIATQCDGKSGLQNRLLPCLGGYAAMSVHAASHAMYNGDKRVPQHRCSYAFTASATTTLALAR